MMVMMMVVDDDGRDLDVDDARNCYFGSAEHISCLD